MNTKTLEIGDKVKRPSFTDCFGNFHEEVTGLIVAHIQVVPEMSIPSYRRITANRGSGMYYCEAAERFFEREA